MIVHNQRELEALDDGTIITWFRIPGDETSEAVAFIRHQDELTPASDYEPDYHRAERTVWISPGGWAPMSVEDAGLNYPVMAFPDPSGVISAGADLMEFDTISGGTWGRDTALAASAQVNQGLGNASGVVLADAEEFLAWLQRDPEAPMPQPEPLAEDDPEFAMDSDLRELMPGTKANIAALALALSRRGWTKPKETP